MKTLTLSEAFEQATKGPLSLHRNEYCEWIGNENGKAMLAKVFEPAGMPRGQSEANAALLAHCFNHMQEAAAALSNLLKHEGERDFTGIGSEVDSDALEDAKKQAKAILSKLNQVQIP